MSNATERFQLPFILPGQAQKELYHNEALTRLDMALHAAVEDGPLGVPPAAPEIGQSWIVAAGASGAWAAKDGQLAHWSDGGWRFLEPQPGMTAWNKAEGHWLHFGGTTWSAGDFPVGSLVIAGQQVVGPRRPLVPSPSGGTVIDVEARAAINLLIETLMSHGLTD